MGSELNACASDACRCTPSSFVSRDKLQRALLHRGAHVNCPSKPSSKLCKVVRRSSAATMPGVTAALLRFISCSSVSFGAASKACRTAGVCMDAM